MRTICIRGPTAAIRRCRTWFCSVAPTTTWYTAPTGTPSCRMAAPRSSRRPTSTRPSGPAATRSTTAAARHCRTWYAEQAFTPRSTRLRPNRTSRCHDARRPRPSPAPPRRRGHRTGDQAIAPPIAVCRRTASTRIGALGRRRVWRPGYGAVGLGEKARPVPGSEFGQTFATPPRAPGRAWSGAGRRRAGRGRTTGLGLAG